MNAKFLSAYVVMLGSAMAFGDLGAAPPRVPPRPHIMADPNDLEKTRPVISREDREKLGLTPKTWTGVVHPDVYPTLDRLNQTVANLKDRLKKGRDIQAFDALCRIHFKGTVYVQVQVKDRDAQRRVLARLKASEFYTQYLFDGAAGIIGYATKEALDKLAKDPEVTGVCLDDQPLPEGPAKVIFRNHLPPPKPGDTSSEQPGVKEGKVEADVYRALDLTDRADVEVMLRTEGLPQLTDKPSEMLARIEVLDRAENQLRDGVLSTVSADDFLLKAASGPGMSGFVTREGLQRLWKHPDVLRIRLQRLVQFK